MVTSVSLNDSYIIHGSCNHSALSCSVLIQELDNRLQRMGKENLLKLRPVSLSCAQFKTFIIHSGKMSSNYFNTKLKNPN